MVLIAVSYQLILILWGYILFGRFEIGEEFLDISDVDAQFLGYQYVEEFILYVIHECWLGHVIRHVDFRCW